MLRKADYVTTPKAVQQTGSDGYGDLAHALWKEVHVQPPASKQQLKQENDLFRWEVIGRQTYTCGGIAVWELVCVCVQATSVISIKIYELQGKQALESTWYAF